MPARGQLRGERLSNQRHAGRREVDFEQALICWRRWVFRWGGIARIDQSPLGQPSNGIGAWITAEKRGEMAGCFMLQKQVAAREE